MARSVFTSGPVSPAPRKAAAQPAPAPAAAPARARVFLPLMSEFDYRRALREVRHDELARCMLNLFATTPEQFVEKIIRAEGYGHQTRMLKRMHAELQQLIEAKAKIDAGQATLGPGSAPPDGAIAAYREAILRMNEALDHYGRLYLPALAEAERLRHDKRLRAPAT